MRVLLTVTGAPLPQPSPAAVRERRRRPREPAPGPQRRLRGLERARRDDLLAQRPAAGRVRRDAQGRLPGDQERRPGRDRARRRARRQRLRVPREALRQRRQGLLRRRRRPHGHRLPDDRPARVLPRAERAHRALLVHGLPRGARDDGRPRRRQARVDDRARLGQHDRRLRARRPRRHQGRRRHPGRAGRLPREGLRLPRNDPWVEQAAWFNLHDLQTGSTNDSLNLGLVSDALRRASRPSRPSSARRRPPRSSAAARWTAASRRSPSTRPRTASST